jgi:7-cyano-7-deazaguanine synthase
VLLGALAAIWCATHDVATIAIGALGDNPFPDATPAFFADFGRALSAGLGVAVELIAPYRGRHKHELIAEHHALPLELSLTCLLPRAGRHCGGCNKCRERQDAFARAGVADPTAYAG